MTATSLVYWNERLGKTDPRCLTLVWEITGAKTVSSLPIGPPVYTTFDAIASQSTINDFLNTTDEFTIAQFDATAMGNDTFGCLVAMNGYPTVNGQVQQATHFEVKCYSSTGGSTLVERAAVSGSLTDSTLETAFEVGAYGNMAFKVDFGNSPDFDGLTSGIIVAQLYWISK